MALAARPAAAGGDPAAQDHPRARPSCSPTATTPVAIELSPTQARFRFGSVRADLQAGRRQVPRLHARHPDAATRTRSRSDRELLRQALQRAAILTNEKFRGVRWVLADGSLKIISTNTEQEEAQEETRRRLQGRRARHRLQRQLPARRAEQPGRPRGRVPLRRRDLQRAAHRSRPSRFQVRRHADADLRKEAEWENPNSNCPTRTTTTPTASRC